MPVWQEAIEITEYGHKIKYFSDDIQDDLNKKLKNVAESLNKIIISLNDSQESISIRPYRNCGSNPNVKFCTKTLP